MEAARGLGTRLAAAREQAGLTQAAAAVALGIPQSRIAKLELGLRQLGFLEGLRLTALYAVGCHDLEPSGERVDSADYLLVAGDEPTQS
jgi:transcriptional regulator with XRE-family HTH domain